MLVVYSPWNCWSRTMGCAWWMLRTHKANAAHSTSALTAPSLPMCPVFLAYHWSSLFLSLSLSATHLYVVLFMSATYPWGWSRGEEDNSDAETLRTQNLSLSSFHDSNRESMWWSSLASFFLAVEVKVEEDKLRMHGWSNMDPTHLLWEDDTRTWLMLASHSIWHLCYHHCPSWFISLCW